MSKKVVKRILLVGLVAGLLITDLTVFAKIGTSIKENRIAVAKAEAKERYKDTLIGFGENVLSPVVEKEKADKQVELQNDLEQDYKKHKDEKPVKTTVVKPLTPQEKEDLGKG